MIFICPRCQRRIVADDKTKDYSHECNSGNLTLDNEDVVKMGTWTDFTGSAVVNNAETQGTENKLFGTRGGIEGEDVSNVTRRGARASTHRSRQHFEFIELQGGGQK